MVVSHLGEFIPVWTVSAAVRRLIRIVSPPEILGVVRINAVLPIVLESEGTPHGLELLGVEFRVELHLVQFLDQNFFFAVRERAEHPVVALFYVAHRGAVFGLLVKEVPCICRGGKAAPPCYARWSTVWSSLTRDRARGGRRTVGGRSHCGSKDIVWGCDECLCRGKATS